MPEKRKWKQADRMRKTWPVQKWEHYLQKKNLSLINTKKKHKSDVQSQGNLELDVKLSDHPEIPLLGKTSIEFNAYLLLKDTAVQKQFKTTQLV